MEFQRGNEDLFLRINDFLIVVIWQDKQSLKGLFFYF